MKLLFVSENWFPDVMGGSGRVVAEMTQRLVALGHEVQVVCRQAGGLPVQSQRHGVRIWRYADSSNPLRTLRALVGALKAVSFSPEVVVICQPLPGLAVLVSGLWENVPKIREFYGPWHEEYEVKRSAMGGRSFWSGGQVRLGSGVRRAVDTWVLKRMTGVRVLSEYTAKMVREMSPKSKILLLPAGVDVDRFLNRPTIRWLFDVGWVFPKDRPLFFTVRNLTTRMGLDVLIAGMEFVAKENPSVLLLIGGQGHLRESLQEQISRLRLEDQVRLLGRISDDDLPAYYQAADAFILPTQALEGFGLVTLEAMACGVPVLATPQGGTLEILGAQAPEFLFRDLSAEAMSEKINDLLKNPEKKKAMGSLARELVLAHYDWNKLMTEYEAYLKTLMVS